MSVASPQNSVTSLSNGGHQLAALDLGSNSFHLLITQEIQGRIQVVDKHKEMVRLAEGLTDKGQLSKQVSERALQCLQRLAQRLRSIDPNNLRIVGTNTLRQLENSSSFLAEAESILGRPIEIISGREEARLIYLGVCHGMGDNRTQELVIDIGGGSTEEMMTVYAIIDSVTLNIAEIRRVGILINGQEIDSLNGHIDLRHPLPPDPSLIVGEVVPDIVRATPTRRAPAAA